MIDQDTFEVLDLMIKSDNALVFIDFCKDKTEAYQGKLIESLTPLIYMGILNGKDYSNPKENLLVFNLDPKISKIIKIHPENKEDLFKLIAEDVIEEDSFLKNSRGN